MPFNKENALQRLSDLYASVQDFYPIEGTVNIELIDATTFGTMQLVSNIYNVNHEFINQIKDERSKYLRSHREAHAGWSLQLTLSGILKAVQFDLENDLIDSLERQTQGEILGDLLYLSKKLADEGYKESAAVLASGALEDTMKKFAIYQSLDVYDKDLSGVIGSIKSKGLLKGPQASVIQSYVQLRNKAFHAQFDKIELPEVKSMIAFTEQFLLENFK